MRIHTKQASAPCKCAIYAASDGEYTAIALAAGSDGTQSAVQSACDLLLRLGSRALEYPTRKAAQLLIDEVYFYAEMQAMAERRKVDKFGVDLTACILSPGNHARLFQLGSCAPFLTEKDFGLRSLALRQPNLRTKANTVSPNAGAATAVSDRVLLPGQGILLCSDSLWELLRSSNALLGAIRREDAAFLRAHAGDCGYIWLLPDEEDAHD